MRLLVASVIPVLLATEACLAGEFVTAFKSLPDAVADYGVVRARSVFAPPVEQPPAIDGKLDEDIYKRSPAFSGFVLLPSDRPASADTLGWAVYDAANLYLAFRCVEPNLEKLRAVVTARDDGMIWYDDSVEVFVDPEHSGQRYYQFILNSDNVLWDARLAGTYRPATETKGVAFIQDPADTKWDSGAKAASGREAGAWTLEAAIPWKAFGDEVPVTPGYSCAFNLCRHRINVEETSNWSKLDGVGGNHNPRRFGLLVLGPEAPYISLVRPPEFFVGTNNLELTVTNPTAEPARINGSITASGAARTEGKAVVVASPHTESKVLLPYTVGSPGARAGISVAVAEDNRGVRFSADYDGMVSPALTLSLARKDLFSSARSVKATAHVGLCKESLAGSTLRLALLDGGGKAIRSGEVKPLSSRKLELTVDVSGLKVGRYLLRGSLLGQDGEALGTTDTPLNVTKDPLDF